MDEGNLFTCTIPSVADVTGSEKSPPGGDTLWEAQFQLGCFDNRLMAPSSGQKLYSRSYDADAALSLRVAKTLDPSSTLIKGSQTGAKIGGITTICGQTRDKHSVVLINVYLPHISL